MTAELIMSDPVIQAAWLDFNAATADAQTAYAVALKHADDARTGQLDGAREAFLSASQAADVQYGDAVTAAWKQYWTDTDQARKARDLAIDDAESLRCVP